MSLFQERSLIYRAHRTGKATQASNHPKQEDKPLRPRGENQSWKKICSKTKSNLPLKQMASQKKYAPRDIIQWPYFPVFKRVKNFLQPMRNFKLFKAIVLQGWFYYQFVVSIPSSCQCDRVAPPAGVETWRGCSSSKLWAGHGHQHPQTLRSSAEAW